jgi:hypothetical protein
MNRLSIKERFFSNNKPAAYKLAFLEVLHNLNGQDEISAVDYAKILAKYSIPSTLDFQGVSATGDFLKFDIFLIKKYYGITVTHPNTAIVALTDPDKTTKIIDAFNRVLSNYYNQNKRQGPFWCYKPQHNRYYNQIIKVFSENRIEDYYLYFYTIFHAKKWLYLWTIVSCTWNYALSIYQQHSTVAKSLLAQATAVQTQKATEESRWIGVYDYIEAKKSFYLARNQAQVCLNNVNTILGYHPKSPHCCICPLSTPCAQNICNIFSKMTQQSQFSLLDLRTGVIDLKEAQRLVPSFDFLA